MNTEPRGWNPIDFEHHEVRSRLASAWATCFVFKYKTAYIWKKFDKMRLDRLARKHREDLRVVVRLFRLAIDNESKELKLFEDNGEIEAPTEDEYFDFLREDESS